MLRRLGYSADAVADGRQVLEILQQSQYDLILMDLQMPVMDGIEATRQIDAIIPTSDCPYVVALTANARKEDERACFECGMDGFLSKPIQVDELLDVLTRAFLRIRARAESLGGVKLPV
jgi:CheY-like chemotaxis protein